MSSKRPSKRRRLETVTNSSDVNDLTNSISSAVTAQVMANLKASGIIPQDTSHANESNLVSMRLMSDRFAASKSSFHKSMKRTASALLRLMPEVVKWQSTQAEINDTCRDLVSVHNSRQSLVL